MDATLNRVGLAIAALLSRNPALEISTRGFLLRGDDGSVFQRVRDAAAVSPLLAWFYVSVLLGEAATLA